MTTANVNETINAQATEQVANQKTSTIKRITQIESQFERNGVNPDVVFITLANGDEGHLSISSVKHYLRENGETDLEKIAASLVNFTPKSTTVLLQGANVTYHVEEHKAGETIVFDDTEVVLTNDWKQFVIDTIAFGQLAASILAPKIDIDII